MHNLPPLVAIAGRKRAGKGTAAAWLVSQHGYELVKFADPLKDMLRTFFGHWGLDEETIERLIEGDLKEMPLPVVQDIPGLPASLRRVMLGGKSSRHAMQTLGTEWRDLLSMTLWVDMAEARIARALDAGGRVVIDDMRFPHEAERILEMGGTLMKVTNNRLPPQSDLHVSEQELPDNIFASLIANDGTFDEMHAAIDRALAKL